MKESPQTTPLRGATNADGLSLLVLPRPSIDELGVRHIVPTKYLPQGDSIEAISNSVKSQASWHSPVAAVVSLLSTAPGAQIDIVTLRGERRTVQLDTLQAMTLWPGSTYRINSHAGGDIIRIQRNLRMITQETPYVPPPASGYSVYTPSRSLASADVVEILPASAVPGFEVILVEGFTQNQPHYHQTFDEAYYNLAGTITVQLTPHDTGRTDTFDVPEGGCAVIPRYTNHHVIGGSENNRILVFYWPRFNGQPGRDWHHA